MAENRRPSRGQVSLGRPRAQDNNSYKYEQHQYTNVDDQEFYSMDLSSARDGAYRAGSWALQDVDEEWGEEEQGYGRGGSQRHVYGHQEEDEDDEENPFDMSSRTHSRNTSASARGHHQQSLTSTTPYTEPTNTTIPALAGISRRIDFTALASSSRANRGHSTGDRDSTTPAVMKKSLMPPRTTTKKQQPKKRFAARAAHVSSSSSPTAVGDPDEDDVVGGGKAGKQYQGHFETGLKATPAEAAAAALSRSTKQTKALKTRSRTGRIVHGAQVAQGDLEREKELERELEREVRLEQGLLGVPVPVPVPPPVQQGQGVGVETEMSPATALVVDTARLQLISPPPEEMLREKRRIAAQTTPSAPPPNTSFTASTTPATPYPNFTTTSSPHSHPAGSPSNANHSPNGTATKRKRAAAARQNQKQKQDQGQVQVDTGGYEAADTSYTPAGIPGYGLTDVEARPTPSYSHYSYSHSHNSSKHGRRLDEDARGLEQGEREEDLYPDPEATPNPKPRKMGRVQQGEADTFVSPTKSVSKSVSKAASKSAPKSASRPVAAHAHHSSSRPRNIFADLTPNGGFPPSSSSSASRFDVGVSSSGMGIGMLMDESMDLDSDLLVRDSDSQRFGFGGQEEDEGDVVMASPTKTHPSRTPKTPSRSKARHGGSHNLNTNRSRGRAPSPSPARSRVRSVGRDEDVATTPTAPVPRPTATPKTARKGRADEASSRSAGPASGTTTTKPRKAKGKGKAKAREDNEVAETTDDDDAFNHEEEEELALETDSGASDTSVDLEMARRRTRDDHEDEDDHEDVGTTPRQTPRKSTKKMVLKSPHANKADADWVPDVVVRVRRAGSPLWSGSPSSSAAGGLDGDSAEEREGGDVLPELPASSALGLASAVKSAKALRRRSVTPIPPYESPPDVFTPPRVVYVQPPQSAARATPKTAGKTPKGTGRKKTPTLKITPPHKLRIKTETPRSVLTKSGKKPKYPAYIDLTLAAPMEPPSPTDDPLLLSGPVGPPIGSSSSPVKGVGRFGGARNAVQGYGMGVPDIPPWAPGGRYRMGGRAGLEGMREEQEEEEEIPIAQDDEDLDRDDGVLPPSSEVDADAEFGSGFASDSGRSASPDAGVHGREMVPSPPLRPAGLETRLAAESEEQSQDQDQSGHGLDDTQDGNEGDEDDDDQEPRFDLASDRTDAQLPPSPLWGEEEEEEGVQEDEDKAVDGEANEDEQEDHEPRFDLESDRTDAQLPPSSPTLLALEGSVRPVEGARETIRPGVVTSLVPGESLSPGLSAVEVEVGMPAIAMEEVVEESAEEEVDEDVEVDAEEGGWVEDEEDAVLEEDDMRAPDGPSRRHHEAEPEHDDDESVEADDAHGYTHGHEPRLERGRTDLKALDVVMDDDDDVLPPSSSPPRIHLLRASSPSRFSLHEGAEMVEEEEEDLKSPARRFGKKYGYEHASVYVRGVDVDKAVQSRVQRREEWSGDASDSEEEAADEEEEVERMEIESGAEVVQDQEAAEGIEVESQEEAEYMREDIDVQDATEEEEAQEEDDVEDSMLHGDPGDEEVAPVPVFGFDFQGAVDAARVGGADADAGGWSSEEDDGREGEEEIDDETLHTMHAQMNSAELAASAAGLRGRDLAMEEGEGTWTGRWRAIKVRTMMDPPSSATKGRIERWSQRRRISPVPWLGERSRSGIVEEEDEEELSIEEGEVEMSVVLDGLDDDDSDADEPKAAASILEDLPPTPAQALHDRARAATRKSLVDAAGISKTPVSRKSAYRPSWARTPAYTVEQTPAATLPVLLHETEQEERAVQAFPTTPTLPLSPPIQHKSPYDPANLVHSPPRQDKDNYTPFAFRTELSRSLWGNAPSSVSTPAPPRNTSGSEAVPSTSTSKHHSGSIEVTSASIISNEKQKHRDDFLEYPAASPDHQPHSPLLQSPFASAVKNNRPAQYIGNSILNLGAYDDDEDIEKDEEEEEYEYEYGYDAYAYDSTWTSPGPRPWTRREWRLLDACFTDERIRQGKRMFPALIARSLHPHPIPPLSHSLAKSQNQSMLRRRSSLGRMKKDQEDADWDFDEGVSILRGNPLAPVEDVDNGRVVRRFVCAASGVVPLKSSEEDDEDEDSVTEAQVEEAERSLGAWGEGWDRDTLAARVEVLERKQREGRVVRMRERLARRQASSKRRGEKRRATIGGPSATTSLTSSGDASRSFTRDPKTAFGAGSKSFAGPSTVSTMAIAKGKGKEKETPNPFDFSFFREQEELEEERRAATATRILAQREPEHELDLGSAPAPTPEPGREPEIEPAPEVVSQSQDEDLEFVPRPQGRRGAPHPRRRVVSGASVSSTSSSSVTAPAQEPPTPLAMPMGVSPKTPARPTTPTATAFKGLSSLRTRTASGFETRSAPASPSKTSERRNGAQGEPRYSYLMQEAVRVHLGLESRDGYEDGESIDVDVDEHEHEPQEHHSGHRVDAPLDGDEQEEDDHSPSASQSEDDDGDDSGEMPTHQQPQAQTEAVPSPGLGTRVKGFLYSYLRPSSVASNLKSTSTSTSTTTTARSRVVSAPLIASSSMPMGPAARARAQAQAQLRAKQTAKSSTRPPPPARATTAAKQPAAKPVLRKGLPMQPPAVLEARAKARARTTRPVVTPARLPLAKPPHPKDIVKLHPPQASASSVHHHSSASNPVRLNTAPTTSKPRQIPVPIPRDLVRLNHVPPPVEKPVVDRGDGSDRPRRPRSSAGSSVKDLVGVFEEMEREAAGSRTGFRGGVGMKPGVFAKDARAREAVRKWRAEARDTRPRWR